MSGENAPEGILCLLVLVRQKGDAMYVFRYNPELEEKGEWRYSEETALVSCPLCGHFSRLSRKHRISPEGEVTPSMVCPWAPCTFHDWIALEGWVPPT